MGGGGGEGGAEGAARGGEGGEGVDNRAEPYCFLSPLGPVNPWRRQRAF